MLYRIKDDVLRQYVQIDLQRHLWGGLLTGFIFGAGVAAGLLNRYGFLCW